MKAPGCILTWRSGGGESKDHVLLLPLAELGHGDLASFATWWTPPLEDTVESLSGSDAESGTPPNVRAHIPVKFSGVEVVEAAKVEVRAWLTRLGVLTEQLTAVQIEIESVEERRKPRLYRVRMELVMPANTVLVPFEHPSNVAHEDLFVAIRNGFRAARRLLDDHFKTLVPTERAAGESVPEISQGP